MAFALAYHIVVATALAYVLWYRLLDSLSATVSSLTTLAVPVVGVLGAMALVGERPGARRLDRLRARARRAPRSCSCPHGACL